MEKKSVTTDAYLYRFGLFTVVKIKIVYPDTKSEVNYYFHWVLGHTLRRGWRNFRLWLRGWRDDSHEEFGNFPRY